MGRIDPVKIGSNLAWFIVDKERTFPFVTWDVYMGGMDLATIVQVAFFGGLAIEGVMIVSLLVTRNNATANRLLCINIISVAYIQAVHFLNYTGLVERVPYLILTPLPAALLSIGSLYLYLCAMTDPGFRMNGRGLIHFLPTLVAAIWCVLETSHLPPTSQVLSPEFFQGRATRTAIALILFAIYYVAAYRRLKRYRQSLPVYFSDFTRVRLNWLNVLFGCSLAIWCVALTDLLLGVNVTLWHVMIPLITVETFVLVVFTLKQSPIFQEHETTPDAFPAVEKKKQVLKEDLFTPEELARETRRLRDYLDREKPYLNPELRLSELAACLGLKAYQLTEIINRGERKNFYELINSYRVEEFKRRAVDPTYSHFSLLGLAMDSGFNSKSVFNETFRKMTGQTPSEFRSSRPPERTN